MIQIGTTTYKEVMGHDTYLDAQYYTSTNKETRSKVLKMSLEERIQELVNIYDGMPLYVLKNFEDFLGKRISGGGDSGNVILPFPGNWNKQLKDEKIGKKIDLVEKQNLTKTLKTNIDDFNFWKDTNHAFRITILLVGTIDFYDEYKKDFKNIAKEKMEKIQNLVNLIDGL